jgi:aldehyde:ferredoxin oxidoreductase
VICLFARGIYAPDVVLQALATAGIEWSADDLTRFAGSAAQICIQAARGFDLSALRIPGRILETPTPLGKIDEQFMRQSIQAYGQALQR